MNLELIPPYEELPVDVEDDAFEDGEGAVEDEDEIRYNLILENLDHANHDDVEKRLAEPEMTSTRKRSYLTKTIKTSEHRRRQVTAQKSNATKKK